jgi:hypothetical protein
LVMLVKCCLIAGLSGDRDRAGRTGFARTRARRASTPTTGQVPTKRVRDLDPAELSLHRLRGATRGRRDSIC